MAEKQGVSFQTISNQDTNETLREMLTQLRVVHGYNNTDACLSQNNLTKAISLYILNSVNYMQEGDDTSVEWTDMMHFQQQLQKVMRSLLPLRKSLLTASECELLAHLYLQPEQNTPVLLSQGSGMKKEAVSRCLKSLYEKGCIRKQRQETDERSYRLFITETGLAELKKGYESILQPFYDLWRSSSEDFEAFIYYADKLAAHIEKGQDKTRDHEVL